jgi:hypothetical protein
MIGNVREWTVDWYTPNTRPMRRRRAAFPKSARRPGKPELRSRPAERQNIAQGHQGRVETVLQAISTGQAQTSGVAVAPKEIAAAPFVVRVRLDDEDVARRLPAGATGTAAIYTEAVKATHVIRRVLLRQVAILNYVNPF